MTMTARFGAHQTHICFVFSLLRRRYSASAPGGFGMKRTAEHGMSRTAVPHKRNQHGGTQHAGSRHCSKLNRASAERYEVPPNRIGETGAGKRKGKDNKKVVIIKDTQKHCRRLHTVGGY